MRKLILSIFIISNIGAGLEVATDYDDAWAEIGILMNADLLQSSTSNDSDGSVAEVDCDHCCHGGAHFAGAISIFPTFPYERDCSRGTLPLALHAYSGAAPPTPPPNV